MTGALISMPGGGERFDRDNRVVTIRIDLPELSIQEIDFDTTFEVSQHTHDDHVDAFYVLDAEVELLTGNEVVRAAQGTLVAVPRGVPHGFRNKGPSRVRLLVLHAPDGGFAQMVRAT
jgi:quercetin dioxygenase-like cupin family protein